MMKWIIVIASILTGIILVFLYKNIDKMLADPGTIPETVQVDDKRIFLIHAYQDEVHRYGGELRLPHSCFAISTNVITDAKEKNTAKAFVTTEDRMLDTKICAQIPSKYQFEFQVDAPENLSLKLYVNDEEREFTERRVQWNSASGTFIKPGI
jgi:hypothetical protein